MEYDEQKKQLEEMYKSQLDNTTNQLQENHDAAMDQLNQQQQQAQKQTDTNLRRTSVESAMDSKNFAELQNAYGLSSGAMAQARVAQDNQLQQDLTTIRAAQQTTDAAIEQQRAIAGRELAAAIQRAQKENDFQKARDLYQLAQQEDARLQKQKEQAANAMASIGDFALYGQLYGLTPEQVAKLEAAWVAEHQPKPTYSGGGGSQDSYESSEEESGTGVDMNSVHNLGYGDLSPQQLAQLEAEGRIRRYKGRDGKWYFVKVHTNPPKSTNNFHGPQPSPQNKGNGSGSRRPPRSNNNRHTPGFN